MASPAVGGSDGLARAAVRRSEVVAGAWAEAAMEFFDEREKRKKKKKKRKRRRKKGRAEGERKEESFSLFFY